MPVRHGKDDWRVWEREFGQHLPAGSARGACRVVQVGDGDGLDTNFRAEAGDSSDQGGPLGANREPVADVFNICAGDDLAIGELEGGADAKVGIRRVGVLRGLLRLGVQVFERRT